MLVHSYTGWYSTEGTYTYTRYCRFANSWVIIAAFESGGELQVIVSGHLLS